MVEVLNHEKLERTLPKPDKKTTKSKILRKTVKKSTISKAVRTPSKKKSTTKSVAKAGKKGIRQKKTSVAPQRVITETIVITETNLESTYLNNPIIAQYLGEGYIELPQEELREPISLMHGVLDADEPGISIPIRVIERVDTYEGQEAENVPVQVQVMEPVANFYIEQSLEVAPSYVSAGNELAQENAIPFSEVYPEILTSLEEETAMLEVQTTTKLRGTIIKRSFRFFISIFTKFAKRDYLKLQQRAQKTA